MTTETSPLRRLDLRGVGGDPSPHLQRHLIAQEEPVDIVRGIIADVRERGDTAILELGARFDGAAPGQLRVDAQEIASARDRIDAEVLAALQSAAANIKAFHETQQPVSVHHERNGIVVDVHHLAVARAGCYVPGGRASYPSSVLMTVIPAKVAGVADVVVCVPPTDTGHIADVTLAAASVAGADEVYAMGGAQAVAGMAYGTESIDPVNVIVGPGNVFVAIAKREVSGVVGVPSAFAGPSEIVVVADATTPPAFAAIDLIVQAEHGPGGLSWLITWDESVADAIAADVERLIAVTPRRDDVLATLTEGGYIVLVDDPDHAIAVSNAIAPEHLQLMVESPAALVPKVQNAGAVFCGAMSPASVGDYAAGPSHVLPTNGSARFGSALTVSDFTKGLHVVTVSSEGLAAIAPTVATLADAEGLPAHAASVRMRIDGGR